MLFMSAGFGVLSSGGLSILSGMSDPAVDPKAAPAGTAHESRKSPTVRRRAAWRLALLCWRLGLGALGNHFEDVAFCGERWLGARKRSATGVDSP